MRLASVGRVIPWEDPCQVTFLGWPTDPPPEAKRYAVREDECDLSPMWIAFLPSDLESKLNQPWRTGSGNPPEDCRRPRISVGLLELGMIPGVKRLHPYRQPQWIRVRARSSYPNRGPSC